jgi:hypothetical protein
MAPSGLTLAAGTPLTSLQQQQVCTVFKYEKIHPGRGGGLWYELWEEIKGKPKEKESKRKTEVKRRVKKVQYV